MSVSLGRVVLVSGGLVAGLPGGGGGGPAEGQALPRVVGEVGCQTATGGAARWGRHAGGRVLSAEFVNNGKTFQAMWFQEPGTKGAYYTLDGQSLRRAFLAAPLAFSRVTSGLKIRFHPILNTWKAVL